MIERASEFGASAAVPLVAGDSTHMTAGDMLRQAREAHGLHIDMVAAALKVSTQKLAALEADDIAALPDPVFARALAASVCRALRIDPQPVLAKLPGAQRPALAEADRTISRSLKSSVPRSSGASSAGALPSRALFVVVLLLLAGAAVMFWLPQSMFDQVGESFAHLIARGEPNQTASAPAPSEPAGATVGPAVPAVPLTPTAPPPQTAAVPTPAVPAAIVAATPPAAPSDIDDNLIVFTAREDSWVTVNEQSGKSLLRRTIKGGEMIGLAGTPPLSVVVGHASGVDVRVRGKPLDLVSLTRAGGVARFEVKP
jgi:cytoskeleton protein RodZ